MNKEGYSWNIDDPESMRVTIRRNSVELFHFSMHEAIESCSRNKVLNHIKECDNTPWLTRWQNEIMDLTVDKLKGK